MKTNIILIALFVAAFMFTSIRSIDTVNAETDISHSVNYAEYDDTKFWF